MQEQNLHARMDAAMRPCSVLVHWLLVGTFLCLTNYCGHHSGIVYQLLTPQELGMAFQDQPMFV